MYSVIRHVGMAGKPYSILGPRGQVKIKGAEVFGDGRPWSWIRNRLQDLVRKENNGRPKHKSHISVAIRRPERY